MNYDGPPDNTSSQAPDLYLYDAGWDHQPDLDNDKNYKNNSSLSPAHIDPNFSIMDTSPDVFFSTLNPNSILTSRHTPLSNHVNLGGSSNDSSKLRQEISSGPHPPNSAPNINSSIPPSPINCFDIFPEQSNRELNFSNILRIGTLNVRSIVYFTKQLNLFSLLLSHQLHGGDLNAEFDGYLKNISYLTISSPINPLFRYLYSHQFDDLSAHLWSYVLDPSDTFSSDHFLLIAFFDFLNIHDLRTPSYLKQRLHYHTEYNIHAALPNHKILFTAEVDSGLKKFTPANGDGHLNNNWHRLKFALLNAAHSAFLKRVISLNKPQAVPEFTDLFPNQIAFIEVLPVPVTLYSIFSSLHLGFPNFLTKFRSSLRTVKKFISGKVTTEFDNYKQVAIKAAIARRNSNFYKDKGKFIRSSLNREKRSIVLDRVLITDISGNSQLLIASDDIHKAAIRHFQNVVGPSRSPFKTLDELPDRWKSRYTPISMINPDIYSMIMAPITEIELLSVINNSPHHKASGPSFIPYE
ncbi:hypothetical protein GLOIN_2v1770668 [Rhizophagus irregularis DAOM 181602=DAOM 197198]|nr:hypothetical protein GLOIN_2v1770668 [Rhizophagus irregularis DAOM 181602=DAOM 197198]